MPTEKTPELEKVIESTKQRLKEARIQRNHYEQKVIKLERELVVVKHQLNTLKKIFTKDNAEASVILAAVEYYNHRSTHLSECPKQKMAFFAAVAQYKQIKG